MEQQTKEIQPHEELTEVINFGSKDEKKVKIGTLMKKVSSEWLQKLPLKPEWPPVKQKLWQMKLQLSLRIREEIKKQLDVGLLVIAKYSQWVAIVVPFPKKDGKVQMYVD